MKKIKQTKAEKIADLIGHDVFSKAEAYYYENYPYYVDGCFIGINFVESLEEFGSSAIYTAFEWHETLEGHRFWYDTYVLIRKWEKEKINW